ncbi:hypothetical protein B0T18DRAFT_387424 [Schizothecium vesticola]|uniref:Ecp2 effector protein-like domain-containing protein n=1 Tax=Schizothecium vesticola TaxID=314040 RepID=A0AA40KA24_9PEZI|nr:hypothetical protein B0T18DRAFT_387424 [Schizothecium vesticola]
MYLRESLVEALAVNLASVTSTERPGPTPTPRTPKLCSDGSPFANNATSSSPLVADCFKPTEHHEIFGPWTYDITKDIRYSNLYAYKGCMTGVRSTVGDAKFNSEDQFALVLAATKGLKNEDRIEGTAKINCDGTEVEWSIYSPRNSEWN